MPWTPGTRVGPYEVIDALGEGGMAQVFRARDTRLGREVAIKVLPKIFSEDPERLRRFEREARVVGMLNHPNILAVYDVGTFENMPYLVTELLHGENLRQHIARGAVPEAKAVAFARQVTLGLALAHEKGVVHRDLKPDNLFWTSDEVAKILDFGLAKFSAPIENPRKSLVAAPTDAGTLLGTAGYMSPEQVQGKTADARSDIFSLGSILYEMVSGRPAFQAETTVETMVLVMRHEPPPLMGASPALNEILRTCLAKDPAERFQTARDLSAALQTCGASPPSSPSAIGLIPKTVQAAATSRSRRQLLAWAIPAAVVLLMLGAGMGHFLWRLFPPQPVFHDISFRRGAIFSGRFAADGEVVYSARWEDQPIQIFSVLGAYPESRPVSEPSAVLLSLSRSGQMAILRDARYLHHLQWSGKLAVMPLGGAPRDLMDNVECADWDPTSEDSRGMAVVRPEKGKTILEFPIGHTIYSTAGWISHARVSPKGGMVAFLDHPVASDSLGDVVVVDSAGVKKMLSSGWSAESGLAWSPDGQQVWFSAAQAGTGLSIYAVTLDGRLRDLLAGPGRLVLEDADRDGRLLVSRDSVRAMMTASIGGEPPHELSWLDQSHGPYFSEDGKQVLFTEGGKAVGPRYAVCLRPTNGSGGVVRLGEGSALGLSPDIKWALAVLPGPPGEMTVIPVGTGQLRTLERGSIETYGGTGAWLPDGKRVLFTANETGKPVRVYVQTVAGGPPRPALPPGYSAVFRAISPDGRSVACREGGQYRICPLDSSDGSLKNGEPPPIPGLAEGEQPLRWTPDGRSFYICDTSKLPLRISKLETSTGKRQLWREITPPDISGLASGIVAVISADGQSVVYAYTRVLSELFVVDKQVDKPVDK